MSPLSFKQRRPEPHRDRVGRVVEGAGAPGTTLTDRPARFNNCFGGPLAHPVLNIDVCSVLWRWVQLTKLLHHLHGCNIDVGGQGGGATVVGLKW